MGVAVCVGFQFAHPDVSAVVYPVHGSSQRLAGGGIGLVELHISLFNRILKGHGCRSAVRHGDRLAGRSVVPTRRIDLRHRIGARREGIRNLALVIGGISFVNPVSRHPELQAGHHPVLALLDDLGGSLCGADTERVRPGIIHDPTEHFLTGAGCHLQHRQRRHLMQRGEILFHIDFRCAECFGSRHGDGVAADTGRQTGGQGRRDRTVHQHPVFIRQAALVGFAGCVPFQRQRGICETGKGVMLRNIGQNLVVRRQCRGGLTNGMAVAGIRIQHIFVAKIVHVILSCGDSTV